jgi:hypothetical protein
MNTVYFDHNVLIEVCKREDVPPSGRFGLLVTEGKIKPIFSSWHWVEAARMRNLAEATRLAKLLDWCNGLWLPDPRSLMLREIKYATGKTALAPFLNSPREVAADLFAPIVGYVLIDSVDVIQRWKTHPAALARIMETYRLTRSSFKRNLRAYRSGLLTPYREKMMILRAVALLAAQHGLFLDAHELSRLDLTRMPALTIEVELWKIEWARGGTLRWQHFVDNQHLIAAMAYVDCYVSSDVRTRKLAEQLKQRCKPAKAKVVASLEEL